MIKTLKIQAFRGFQKEQEVPLSPTLTVIYGGNGRGKTSLCEGWHWLFTGNILENLNPQSELNSAEENIHADAKPHVKLMDERGNLLIERSEEEFNNPGELPTSTSPVLLQYRLQQVLYTSQANRREFFEKVMGLQVESNFANKLRRACRNIDPFENKAWEAWQRAIKALEQVNYSPPHPSPNTSNEQKENEESLKEELGNYFGCRPDLNEIEKAIKTVNESEELPLDQTSLPIQESEISKIKAALQTIDLLDKESERAIKRAQWREEGLDFLEPPECPFCMEPTIGKAKVENIQNTIDETKEQHRKHKEAKGKLDKAVSSIMPLANLDIEETLGHFLTLEKHLKEIDIEAPDGWDAKIRDLKKSLKDMRTLSPVKKSMEKEDLSEPEIFEDVADAAIAVTKDWIALTPLLEDIRQILKEDKTKVHYTESATSLLQYNRKDLEVFYKELDAAPPLNEIADAAPETINELKRERLENLQDNIKKLYKLLRPYEYTHLEEINSAKGVRGDIRIKARSQDKVEHASVLFSYSNANALGIAAHVARVIEAGHETVVLDDPFQSLDDTKKNILIKELIKELLERGLQVIVLTHKKGAAQKLLDIYASRDALGSSLQRKIEEGPVFKPMYPTGDRQLERILDVIIEDDTARIKEASGALRRLLERMCADYLKEVEEELPPSRDCRLGIFIKKLESLESSVRPTRESLENLEDWHDTLSGDIHEDVHDNMSLEPELQEAPGMEQIRIITEKALWARKHHRQLKPPNCTKWRNIPNEEGLQKRCNKLLDIDK